MTNATRILIVEDKESEREALARLLRMEKYDVVAADGPAGALEHLDEQIELVISDLRMGKTDGVDLLRYWKGRRPRTPFIMVTAHGDVNSAVEAMKLGAEDYLSKPVNPDELLLLVAKCLKERRKDETIEGLQQRLDKQLGFENIVAQSKLMLDVFDNARRAAATDSTVLITGESGTGKELIAEAIHQNSPRKEESFVVVNMAAVPQHLVESELFGHVKGAFTGAMESRIGRFEAANGGTIFIDEIGDFKVESQAKLLRVLENRTVTPIGSNENRTVNVRVVAATSRNLEQMVRDEEFREDLYYRLNVINLRLPPLRDRREDIPLLIGHFLEKLCAKTHREPLQVDAALKRYLESYDWPGNVRQLRNCLESMVVLARGDSLTLDDIPATLELGLSASEHVAIPPGTSLHDLEREAVEQALRQHDGNRTHAARTLGISVRTLQRKLKAWGLANGEVPAQ
jgi:two-component system, NtrC family, response regulator HydG